MLIVSRNSELCFIQLSPAYLGELDFFTCLISMLRCILGMVANILTFLDVTVVSAIIKLMLLNNHD